jgi:hypothetical protein
MMDDYRASWQNPRILLTLFLVFLCGLVTGVLVTRYGLHQALHKPGISFQQGGKEVSLQKMKKELNLTPSQEEEIRMVLNDYALFLSNVQSQMDDVRGTGKKRILAVLNSEQRQRFEQMISK